MQKREKIMLGMAGGSALFFAINQFLCTPPPKPPKSSPVVATAPASEQKSEGKSRGRRSASQANIGGNRSPRLLRTGADPHVRFADWRRDPFRGVITFLTTFADTTVEADKLNLNGIAWKKGEALALIGNAILRKGETAGNMEVLDIRDDRVLCRIDGELVTFLLKQDEDDPQKP